MKNPSAFYGDTGGGTEAPTDIRAKTQAENSGGHELAMSVLRKHMPRDWWVWQDSHAEKRLSDELRGALSAHGTTPEQDSLLRQESPEMPEEEEDDWAARTAADMQKKNPEWVLWSDPRKRQEFIQGLRDKRGGPRAAQQQPQKSPTNRC